MSNKLRLANRAILVVCASLTALTLSYDIDNKGSVAKLTLLLFSLTSVSGIIEIIWANALESRAMTVVKKAEELIMAVATASPGKDGSYAQIASLMSGQLDRPPRIEWPRSVDFMVSVLDRMADLSLGHTQLVFKRMTELKSEIEAEVATWTQAAQATPASEGKVMDIAMDLLMTGRLIAPGQLEVFIEASAPLQAALDLLEVKRINTVTKIGEPWSSMITKVAQSYRSKQQAP